MNADKLADFETIETTHGDGEVAFCIFFLQGSLSLYNKDFQQCSFLYASLFLECQYIAGQTGLHYLIFLWI